MDLAPSQLISQDGKSFSSLFSEGKLEFFEQRDREFNWSHEAGAALSVLDVYSDRIVIGLTTGEIKLFSTVDLRCKQTLSHPKLKSKVTCFHCCTSTGIIIAGYEDASACIWNTHSGDLSLRFCVGNRSVSNGYAMILRMKETKLVVATAENTIRAWSYEDSAISFVKEWATKICVQQLEVAGDLVALKDLSDGIYVYKFDGTLVHTLHKPDRGGRELVIRGNYVIVGDKCRNLYFWDISTGSHVRTLSSGAHGSEIIRINDENSHVMTVDRTGPIVIWSLEEMLANRPAALIKVFDPSGFPQPATYCSHYSLGENCFVRLNQNGSAVKVTDFL